MNKINAEISNVHEGIPQEQDYNLQDPYANLQAQNIALQKEYLDVLKHYTEDSTIPEEISQSKWSVFGKALQLTFLEERDLPMIDMFNNVLRINSLMNKPSHMLSFGDTDQLDQTQLFFYINAKRAIGTNHGKINERTLQVTQIGQNITTNTNNNPQPRSNMFGKLRQLF